MFQFVGDPRTVRDDEERLYFSARAAGEGAAAATVQRSLFKSGRAAPAGKSALTRQIERLSAACRALTGEAQRESIGALLRFNGRRPARSDESEMLCFMCGDDEFDGCFCE